MKNKYKVLGDSTKIFLKDGSFALIDTNDLEKVKNAIPEKNHWIKNTAGYITGFDSDTIKTILLHRLIMDFPEGKDVDHFNHFKWDNQKENLIVCTRSENSKNKIAYEEAYKENERIDKKRGILKMNGKKIEPLMTNQDVMELLNVNERTLYDYRENKGLPYFKLNQRTFRYEKEMVLKWLSERLENNKE